MTSLSVYWCFDSLFINQTAKGRSEDQPTIGQSVGSFDDECFDAHY
ncbi:hypothetical protein D918_01339 [Trichuris suis]|nr:hypothetical protein D918_01339 [Trichuris suis]